MQKHIDEIMDNFDFGKVHRVMEALNWTWFFTGGVPDEAEIRRYARERLVESARNKAGSFSGGFEARYRSDDDGPWLELRFVVEEWSTAETQNG